MTKGGFRQLTGKVKKLHTGNSSQKKKTEVIFSCIEKKQQYNTTALAFIACSSIEVDGSVNFVHLVAYVINHFTVILYYHRLVWVLSHIVAAYIQLVILTKPSGCIACNSFYQSCSYVTRKPCCRRESARCRCNFRSIDQDMINKDQWRTDFKLSYVTYLLNL